MKKFVKNIVIAAVALIALSACSSDDEPVSEYDKQTGGLSIIGFQWQYQAITANPAVDVNGDGKTNVDLFNTGEFEDSKLQLEYGFGENPGEGLTYVITDMESFLNGGEWIVESGTFEFDDETDTITMSNGEVWKVLKRKGKEFVIETERTYNGVNTTLTITFYSDFAE